MLSAEIIGVLREDHAQKLTRICSNDNLHFDSVYCFQYAVYH